MKVNRNPHRKSGFHWDRMFLMLKMSAFLVILTLQLSAKGYPVNGNGVPPPDKVLTGKVVGPDNEPLIGATVTVVGKSTSAVTGADGSFKISIPAGSRKISISSVGFANKEMTVSDNDKNILVKLETQINTLNDVVVTSMGIQKQQKSLGYATTTIKSSELVQTASTNFASALYGKAPGVRIATAPGGSNAGVAIQIRGINSIFGRTQPLIVMDGVPIRDGDFNNTNYWGDQRVRGNGLTDLNTEDIESLTILKGASAAALYGSEATNGVVVITTKSGKAKKGITVEASANFTQDEVAYLPDFQTVRGTGVPTQYQSEWGVTEDANGFSPTTYNINGQNVRSLISSSVNFGPKFDGQPIVAWDGVVRPYSPIKDGWKHLFQKANNSVQNIAFSSTGDNSSTRFSFSRQHFEGVSIGSANDKYSFNINSVYKFSKNFNVNLIISDVFAKVKNRPYMDDRLINNFTGMMPTFDDGNWYRNKFQTSLGYRYVTGLSTNSLTPGENLYIPNIRTDILDFMWSVQKNTTMESNNRLIASATANWDIAKGLQLRGKLATDWTSNQTETKNFSPIPTVFGYSGSYGLSTNSYSIFYGDLMLNYTRKLNKDLDFSARAIYTADKESGYNNSVSTNGGLTTANRFDITSSANTPYNSGNSRSYLTKDAFAGTVNVNYKGYWYVEGTVRRDRTSTMNPDNNSFVYPSINSALVLSEAFKLPSLINYAKLRGSWGVVGNYPAAYQANVAYSLTNYGNQGTGSTLGTSAATGTYGNNSIKPERKNEIEFGLETRMLNNRLNVDVSYYNAKTIDQIVPLQLAPTTGATGILANIGTLQNTGIEFSINGTPVLSKNFSWEAGVNFSFNNNKILKLTDGSNEFTHADYDGNAAVLKSVVGNPIGDFYAHPVLTDAKGAPVVVDAGGGDIVYQLDASKMVKYGNAQVKSVGGFFNTFHYKAFTLEFFTDFRIGGDVMPTGLMWMHSRGLTNLSLGAMDEAHGGVSYYKDSKSRGVETSAAAGPNGEKVYHDGMKLGGVFADGSPNNFVTPQFYYYNETYNWGGPQYSHSQYLQYIQTNTYWKMREMILSYNLPASLIKKIGCSKMQLSVFGRNLFYLYRSIKDMDAEQLTGGLNWAQSVNNGGSQPATRTFGVSLRATF